MRGQAWRFRALRATAAVLLCAAGGPAHPAAPDVPPTGRAAGDEPATVVAVALDASGSLSDDEIARSRDLAAALLDGLPAGSEMAVFSFDDQSRLLQPRTTDVERIRAALSGVKRTGRYTALHDALYDASRYLNEAPGARRAIVLMTDGIDENSSLTLEDGLRVAQDARIPVFAVGMGRVQERVLRRIAKLTGGEYLPGERLGAAALAARVQDSPATPAGAPAAPERRAESLAPRPDGAADSGRPGAGRSRTLLFVWLVSLLAAAIGAVALFLARRRPGVEEAAPASDTTLQTNLSDTVLQRLDETEEYLEKTITLRERPVLTITSGPGAGELFELSQATAVSIGRARANDIVLKDVSISGQHCRIRPEQGGFVLHDLRSTNGTFVNDRRVSRHTLADGDEVQIGETVMQFRSEYRRA